MRRDLMLDRFEVIEELGSGGFAKVFRCFDLKMEREVAIKQLAKGAKNDLRTMREISTTALLNHPNIVTLYEFLEDEKDFFLIMEYIDGLTLSSVLRLEAPLSAEETAAIATQVALALEFAHQNDVIHRDIKPDNIMLLADGRIKVMDFGIARLKGAPALTVEKSFLGTLGYVSPEQAQGEYVDEATDIFALGVLVYAMLAGQNPFEAETAAATLYKIINIEPPPISEVAAGVPRELDPIIDQALDKEPDKRQRTVTALRYKIERLLPTRGRPEKVLRPLFARAAEMDEDDDGGGDGLFDDELSFIRDGLSSVSKTGPLLASRVVLAILLSTLLFFGLKGGRFYSSELAVILPLVDFFITLIFPLFGLIFAALVAAVPMAAFSFSLSLAFLAISSLYIFKLARVWPEEAASFSAAPLLAYLGLAEFFPLAIGILLNPAPAAMSGAAGCLFVETWGLFANRATFGSVGNNMATPPSSLFSLFRLIIENPAFLIRPVIWSAATFLVALLAKNKRFLADLIAGGVGAILLLLGEIWLPALKGAGPLSFSAALQKLSFSFIMLIIFIGLFHYIKITLRTTRRGDRG